jgi:tellurite resistance protein TehA-like permease
MSMFWWILIVYLVWMIAGLLRAISLLGHKNHKETLIDKILITGAMPIACIIAAITFIRRKFNG